MMYNNDLFKQALEPLFEMQADERNLRPFANPNVEAYYLHLQLCQQSSYCTDGSSLPDLQSRLL